MKVWLSTSQDGIDNSGATAPELHRLLHAERLSFVGWRETTRQSFIGGSSVDFAPADLRGCDPVEPDRRFSGHRRAT